MVFTGRGQSWRDAASCPRGAGGAAERREGHTARGLRAGPALATLKSSQGTRGTSGCAAAASTFPRGPVPPSLAWRTRRMAASGLSCAWPRAHSLSVCLAAPLSACPMPQQAGSPGPCRSPKGPRVHLGSSFYQRPPCGAPELRGSECVSVCLRMSARLLQGRSLGGAPGRGLRVSHNSPDVGMPHDGVSPGPREPLRHSSPSPAAFCNHSKSFSCK